MNKPEFRQPGDTSTKVLAFLGDQFQKRFSNIYYIFLCKNQPPLWSHPTSQVMIFTILNPHYLRMLSHTFQVSWPIGFWEDFPFYIPMKKFDTPTPQPHCGPTLLLRIMLWTNSHQHTLRMLNTYYSIFSQIVFENRFLKIKNNRFFLVISS